MLPNKDTEKDKKMKISTTTIFLGMILLIFIGGCKQRSTVGDKHKLARAKMAVIEAAILQYFYDCSRYPDSLEELLKSPAELNGKWNGPYLKTSQLLDPWGNKYIYVPEGKVNPGSFDLISYGADGSPGGEGYNKDIYND
jgi:general secretion pathway protein G